MASRCRCSLRERRSLRKRRPRLERRLLQPPRRRAGRSPAPKAASILRCISRSRPLGTGTGSALPRPSRRARRAGRERVRRDRRDEKTKPPSLAVNTPRIVVATSPTELIVTQGSARYVAISNTDLLYVDNTTGNVFRYTVDQQLYVLMPDAGVGAAAWERSGLGSRRLGRVERQRVSPMGRRDGRHTGERGLRRLDGHWLEPRSGPLLQLAHWSAFGGPTFERRQHLQRRLQSIGVRSARQYEDGRRCRGRVCHPRKCSCG